MNVFLHQDVLGYKADPEKAVEVDGTHAEWLVANGYASKADSDGEDMHLATTTDAESDPTLAANREEPNELDAAGLEDESQNDEATKLAEAQAAERVKMAPATEKRDPRKKKTTADDSEPSEG